MPTGIPGIPRTGRPSKSRERWPAPAAPGRWTFCAPISSRLRRPGCGRARRVYHDLNRNSRAVAMLFKKRTPVERYAVAVIAVAVAFGLRYGIYGTLDNRIPFGFFTTATLIAAWYGGLGPGMLAAIA